MSERPTPETDAQGWGDGLHPWVATDFARKLERERDEAMELLASEKITRNHIIKRSVEVEQERDEAREAWYVMQSSFERSRDEVEKLIRERDEAREAVKYWQELCKKLSPY